MTASKTDLKKQKPSAVERLRDRYNHIKSNIKPSERLIKIIEEKERSENAKQDIKKIAKKSGRDSEVDL